MATLYLMGHGQPDYSGLQERGMFGFGRASANPRAALPEAAPYTGRDTSGQTVKRFFS